MVATLANPSVNDEFVHAERKEASEPVIVATAATLTDIVAGTASWLVEIQYELVTFSE